MAKADLLAIPELVGLDTRQQLVRIPPQLDVPLTERVRRIIDTAEFRRLARISQLGLVSLVYPAAIHTRFEHCLGVYRLALLTLKQLAHDPRFHRIVSADRAELFIVAALLHDLGHWPFCHPIEDLELPDVPRHETFATEFLLEGELARVLRQFWSLNPEQVVVLLTKRSEDPTLRLLSSMLSGPVDVDKMDYLYRDSLHAGVPYGRNFDQQRLLGSLCLNESGDGLAIRDKGKTAAELMVFARYVMFSEVYWHHGVRSATAMLQRAFYVLRHELELDSLFRMTEPDWIVAINRAAIGTSAEPLLAGIFGPTRQLFKRVAQFSIFENTDLYQRLARRPYPWLVECAERFAELASRVLGIEIGPHEVLFDAPPLRREVQFDVDIYFPKEDRYRPLGEVSPVVRTLAEKQFDDYVKRVRIFAAPSLAPRLRALPQLQHLILEAANLVS